MLYDILLFSRLSTTRIVNGFIYFLQRIPVIGKLFHDSLYSELAFKKGVSIAVWLFRLLYLLVKSGCYVGICIVLPATMLHMNGDTAYYREALLYGFLILTGLLGAFQNGKLLQVSNNTQTMTRQMRMSAKRYLKHNALYLYMINTISMFIGFAFFTFLYEFSILYALLACCIYLGTHIGIDGLQLKIFDKTQQPLQHYKVFNYIEYAVLLPAVLIPFAFHITIPYIHQIFIVFAILCIPFGIWGYIYVRHYQHYPDILHALLEEFAKVLAITNDKSQAAKYGISVDEKDYTKEELSKKQIKLHGYALLNTVFFQRHKRLIQRPLRRRVIIIFIVSVTTFVITYVTKTSMEFNILALLPTTVFLMYLLNISERVTRAMFMNCDVSLLHYSYYRKRTTIMKNFMIRLLALVKYNLFIAGVLILCSNLCLFLLPVTYSYYDLLLADFTILILSVFFCIHYLFAYYIFQPYNEQFSMKNPFFSFLNGIVYLVCYACINLEGNIIFIGGVLGATILYMIIALLLVYQLAHKTFHLK